MGFEAKGSLQYIVHKDVYYIKIQKLVHYKNWT